MRVQVKMMVTNWELTWMKKLVMMMGPDKEDKIVVVVGRRKYQKSPKSDSKQRHGNVQYDT
jgi:hypothetical protein